MKITRKNARFFLFSLPLALLTGCFHADSTASIPAVRNFDAERYMGRWYEIARLPHRFERDLDFVVAEYSLNPDGTVKVLNSGMRSGKKKSAEGRAKWKKNADPGTAELEVTFFAPFSGDYRVILLEADYSSAIVTSSSRDYLWILSRTPELPEEGRLEQYLSRCRDWGFDVERLEYPRQEKNSSAGEAKTDAQGGAGSGGDGPQ